MRNGVLSLKLALVILELLFFFFFFNFSCFSELVKVVFLVVITRRGLGFSFSMVLIMHCQDESMG